ncbi:unnamed protein product [Paramecium primaurelia]|uniref:non-specific serine/threonine protein kinase n=1 Tax=Paramecium primaurelia TaxID=5886 RepID=A0A8S1QIK8_PARPR|nr:unnamed protein product [Paramecium primaurelia]
MQTEEKHSKCGEYVIIEKLGHGYHAKVKLAEKDGKKVAIKLFKTQHNTAKNIKALVNEIKILKQLNHPNVINLIQFSDALPYKKKNGTIIPRVCIILELAQKGELFQYVASSGRFAPEITRYYFKQLLSAMIYMTSKGICHRDLKLENILLDENFNLKVADFGFAKVMETPKQKTNLGTPGYTAPEITQNGEYNGTQADIFSAGVILFILHAGSPPFSIASETDPIFKLIIHNKRDEFWYCHTKNRSDIFPQDFKNLIDGMLAPNPDERFTLDQCLQHPWTNGAVATPEQIKIEFKKRYARIQAESQASQMKLKAQKQNILRKPIGKFRSIIGETEQEDFTETIEKQKLNLENRFLNKGQVTGLPNEILLYLDPNFILCYLLKYCTKFNSKVKKIHTTKYKINFVTNEEIDETIEYSIEFLDCENELIKVNITKNSGDYFQFNQIYNRIKNILQENYKEYLKEEIQQE